MKRKNFVQDSNIKNFDAQKCESSKSNRTFLQGRAHFILEKKKVHQQYDECKKVADIISYSYKTNPEVGTVLRDETESFFSVHSIQSIKDLNCPKRVWFFSQAWDKDEILELYTMGVSHFVIDNISDLNTLLEVLSEKNDMNIELLLRMRLKEHTLHTGKHFVFGLYSKQINELLPKLSKNKCISKLGIHVHRKTQNVSEWDLKEELEESINCWEHINIVNIGGGLPAAYKNYRKEVLQSIFNKIIEFKTWLNTQNISMIIEPGRFIAAAPISLVTTIINKYANNLVIDCSVFNGAMDTFIANIKLLVKEEVDEQEGDPFLIKGNTPDSMDIFRYKVYLKDPKVGDQITFLSAGAYNFTCDFCNLPKPKTIIK